MSAQTKNLQVYAADLTHTYIALASGTFPLGLAYVASALKKVFGNSLDIELFKYADDLEKSIKRQKPDIFFFSNYTWNQNLNLEFARRIKEAFPDTLVVSGGPNLSKDPQRRKLFLKTHPFIDFCIAHEGELAVCYLIKKYGSSCLSVGELISLKQYNMALNKEGRLLIG